MVILLFKQHNPGSHKEAVGEPQRPLLECTGRFTATSLKLLSQ